MNYECIFVLFIMVNVLIIINFAQMKQKIYKNEETQQILRADLWIFTNGCTAVSLLEQHCRNSGLL